MIPCFGQLYAVLYPPTPHLRSPGAVSTPPKSPYLLQNWHNALSGPLLNVVRASSPELSTLYA